MSRYRVPEPQFLVKNGVRSVAPYYHEYRTPFKERWAGKLAPEILQSELGQTEAALHSAIDMGHLYVTANNGKSGGPMAIKGSAVYTHLLRGHDVIHNLQHCHEPNVRVAETGHCASRAVNSRGFGESLGAHHSFKFLPDGGKITQTIARLEALMEQHSQVRSSGDGLVCEFQGQKFRRSDSGIDILYEDHEVVIVNKPSGVPTHPGGIYRYNTMSEILAYDVQGAVWPCHRLDKATLGVMVFAKSKKTSSEYMKLFLAKNCVEKWYVARVKGRFPHEACRYTCPVFSLNTAGNTYVNVPNQTAVPTNSVTEFYRVHYSGEHDNSIVLCRPVTGRMHQIRIHLRNLGYPIANDTLYNKTTEISALKNDVELQIYGEIWEHYPVFAQAFGPKLGPQPHAAHGPSDLIYPPAISIGDYVTPDLQDKMNRLSELRAASDTRAVSGTCAECRRPLYTENHDPDAGIWLHALALRWRTNARLCLISAPCPGWCA